MSPSEDADKWGGDDGITVRKRVSILIIERPYGETAPGGGAGSCGFAQRESVVLHPFDYAQGGLRHKNKNAARVRHTGFVVSQVPKCEGPPPHGPGAPGTINKFCKWLMLLVLAAMAAASGVTQETSSNVKETAIKETAATDAVREAARRANLPPRVVQAERFLAERGWTRDRARGSARGGAQAWVGAGNLRRSAPQTAVAEPNAAETAKTAETANTANTGMTQAMAAGQGTATWLPLGPTAVQSQNFGLVTGRISALALDSSDTTGNTLYVGTTGGGVWKSQNADTSSAANINFIPLTDNAAGMGGGAGTSISIGALSVQPGGTGVILAGTGDPNDALDSYYGAGILRSTDGGTTWSLISITSDQLYSFAGEGIAGFAWSTANQQLVVAAVSQAYEGTLVNADWPGQSYEGLYYSSDGGATWSLATITDGTADVQGPADHFVKQDGNAATAVVWNPVRQLFVAAVRYHGYYQSADGITWTRMANQPGAGLMTSAGFCPTNSGSTGLQSCPIFRGALAVNPRTGDTFAWTVDVNKRDQGIWMDQCLASAGACSNQTITFAYPLSTAALEVAPPLDSTIANGDYNLALAAVPSGQETMLLAGGHDLWKCSLTDSPSPGCVWRNTTNSTAGFCARVGEYQHSLAWNANNPLVIFVGNDSGLWRSTDAIGETGTVCNASDATHFQNLNGSLGSLAEVVSLSQAGATPYTMMAGLGAIGTAGVNSTTGTTTDWPEILGGEGGPVAIDPVTTTNWNANNGPGVSIYRGTPPNGSTPGAFNAVVTDADVGGDGLKMTSAAPFLVDPLDNTKLLIGTCRVWRGEASGVGWSSGDAISLIFDNPASNWPCNGDALIRSMAAMALPSGGEVVYVGMYGSANGGGTLAGHVLSATYNSASGTWSAWADVTALNAVTNDTHPMNYLGFDISSLFIDPHDSTGQTVYVTVAGISGVGKKVQTVYSSTDGGTHWTTVMANLPSAPANSLVVDPQDAETVYVATDAGVYSTQQISSCAGVPCWSAFGSGLPEAPVVALSATPATASTHELVAATYGRGIWINPLWGGSGVGSGPATDTLSVTALSFPSTIEWQQSAAQTVTLTNSGSVPLTVIVISVSGAFRQANNCTAILAANSSCAISVQFYPAATGSQTGTLSITDAQHTQPETVALSGTGLTPPVLSVSPASLTFTSQTVGQASPAQTVTVSNSGGAPLANAGFQTNGLSASSFSYGSTTCGATLANGSSCTVQVTFAPTTAGGATASLVVSSSTSGVAAATVPLTGTSQNPAGLNVSPVLLVFPIVAPGKSSASQVTITNNGGTAVNSLTFPVTLPFSTLATTNSCGTSLGAGASCTIGVVFAPALDGNFTGTLTIASSSQTQGLVLLSGVGGVPGSVQFQPGLIDPCAFGTTAANCFPQTGVSLTSSASTATITNPDPVTSLRSLALAASAGFKLVNNACPSTLAALASCTVGVEFAPSTVGTQSGTLIVSDSVLAPGSIMTLSGTGFDFVVVPSGSSTQTVANGQTAYYTLSICGAEGCTLTPTLVAQGAFTFQCGSLPTHSACTFSPSSENVPAGTTGNVTVQIATGLTTASVNDSPPLSWSALPLACGLVIMPFALRHGRKVLLLVALLAILMGGVSSCTSAGIVSGGNASGGGTGSGITTAGTFPVVVTATSNGVQHQVTLTLIVD